MKKEIILENYEFSKRSVRVKDEDELLFTVHNSSDYKRSKNDADNIGVQVVKAFNEYNRLQEENRSLMEMLRKIILENEEEGRPMLHTFSSLDEARELINDLKLNHGSL